MVCYCSLYGDCCESQSEACQPTAVKVCKDDPARRFVEWTTFSAPVESAAVRADRRSLV